jgi:hypothetical protein
VNLGNAEENRLFVVKSDKQYFITVDNISPEVENNYTGIFIPSKNSVNDLKCI